MKQIGTILRQSREAKVGAFALEILIQLHGGELPHPLLADQLGVRITRVNAATARLQEQGMVSRYFDKETDKRSLRVAITERGLAHIEKLSAIAS